MSQKKTAFQGENVYKSLFDSTTISLLLLDMLVEKVLFCAHSVLIYSLIHLHAAVKPVSNDSQNKISMQSLIICKVYNSVRRCNCILNNFKES